MKVVVVGASGTMGSKAVRSLERDGREVIQASTSTGVNVLTGDGLDEAFKGADAIIDVTNFGSFGRGDALTFFKQSGGNLLRAAKRMGVGHYLALSVVGAETLVENDYFRAKLVQENLIRASGVPHTIVRSTQFFEFLSGIVGSSADSGAIRLPALRLQPIAGDEAASWLAKLVGEKPSNSVFEVGGPEAANLTDLASELLTITEDTRPAVTDPDAQYFGVSVPSDGLIPRKPAALGRLTYHDWLSRTLHD